MPCGIYQHQTLPLCKIPVYPCQHVCILDTPRIEDYPLCKRHTEKWFIENLQLTLARIQKKLLQTLDEE